MRPAPRLARPGDAFEQGEVLHVACADLDDVGGLLDGVGIVRVHQLGHDADARFLSRLLQDGQSFQPRLILPLCVSYDHRVVDGALAARFTRRLAEILGDVRQLAL